MRQALLNTSQEHAELMESLNFLSLRMRTVTVAPFHESRNEAKRVPLCGVFLEQIATSCLNLLQRRSPRSQVTRATMSGTVHSEPYINSSF